MGGFIIKEIHVKFDSEEYKVPYLWNKQTYVHDSPNLVCIVCVM